jgi:predicted secreted acid phosphatase
MVARCIFPVLIAVVCGGCVSTPREPTPNITILKNACIEWHASGGYDAALQKSVSEARAELERYLRRETPQNFAIVLDIDETLLSNWQYLKANQFAITPASFAAWMQSERAVALAATRELYARAQAYSIPIFLVTGRNESLRNATIRDLEEAGYWGWSGLYMKPSGYADVSIIPFKSGVRKMLTDHGYDIILNVGDQDSDLAGGFARRAVKLPNPFYFIP